MKKLLLILTQNITMKRLLILLCLPLLFTTCKKEDEAPPALAIGNEHQGGIIFWLDGNGGGLIAAPSGHMQAAWGCNQTLISGAYGTAIGTGAQNTIDIEAGCLTAGTAADICANLTLGGYSDWFLPSRDELNEIEVNLFSEGIGGFANDRYWSSTQGLQGYAFSQSFYPPYPPNVEDKNHYLFVRAVRAF